MSLSYPPFLATPGILAAYRNAPALRKGSQGLAVRVLQSALLQLGYSLPKSSMGKVPDGSFGSGTEAALKASQVRAGLVPPDGIAGRNTIQALDRALVKPVPEPPPKSLLTTMTNEYKLGTEDPPFRPDPGSGAWRSKPAELAYISLMAAMDLGLATVVVFGKDATNHLRHYFGNMGTEYPLDLEAMVSDVPSAGAILASEVEEVRRFVERLPLGTYAVTSRQMDVGYNRQSENANWYFATGGYKRWGKGVAKVKSSARGREYELAFEYHVLDRYNWDTGKQVEIPSLFGDEIVITDRFMGEFHRQGLAREFLCRGVVKRSLSWRHGERIAPKQLAASGLGR